MADNLLVQPFGKIAYHLANLNKQMVLKMPSAELVLEVGVKVEGRMRPLDSSIFPPLVHFLPYPLFWNFFSFL